MPELCRKNTADGIATIETSDDITPDEGGYQVVVTDKKGLLGIVLPAGPEAATRETAQAIFDSLNEETTMTAVLKRALKEALKK